MNEWLLDTGVLLWWLAADPRLGGYGVPIVEAMELPELLERQKLGPPRRQPGQPCPRPVRRSGDDLEGEAHADPTALRRTDNPSGAINGPPGALGGDDDAPKGEPGAGGAGKRWRTDYGERARAETGGVAEEHEDATEPDPVVLRPIPRWNAFPWGGLFRSGEGDE